MRTALAFVGRPELNAEDTFEIVTPINLLLDVLVIINLLREPPNLYVEDNGTPLRAIIRRAGDDFRKKAEPDTKGKAWENKGK